ncbi:hypothetical protein GCM10025866_13100 [Naasia aerilata]|uniref:FHA domain-containing protein n=1 Tax=Naasia aerilata TaxID=1162966 RepID=A0ABM8GB07_9MICO|nr:hypothetical protein GCM10025866_13100 [Naasia aerilata]
MSDLTLLILRIAFLVLLWAFVFAIVYALRSDLFGTRVRRLQEQPAFAAAPASVPVSTPPAVQSLPTGPPTPAGASPSRWRPRGPRAGSSSPRARRPA